MTMTTTTPETAADRLDLDDRERRWKREGELIAAVRAAEGREHDARNRLRGLVADAERARYEYRSWLAGTNGEAVTTPPFSAAAGPVVPFTCRTCGMPRLRMTDPCPKCVPGALPPAPSYPKEVARSPNLPPAPAAEKKERKPRKKKAEPSMSLDEAAIALTSAGPGPLHPDYVPPTVPQQQQPVSVSCLVCGTCFDRPRVVTGPAACTKCEGMQGPFEDTFMAGMPAEHCRAVWFRNKAGWVVARFAPGSLGSWHGFGEAEANPCDTELLEAMERVTGLTFADMSSATIEATGEVVLEFAPPAVQEEKPAAEVGLFGVLEKTPTAVEGGF